MPTVCPVAFANRARIREGIPHPCALACPRVRNDSVALNDSIPILIFIFFFDTHLP